MSKSSKIFQIGRVLRGHTYGNIIRFCKQTGLTQLKNQKIRGKKSDKEISIHGVVLIEIRSNCYHKNEKKRHHLSQQQNHLWDERGEVREKVRQRGIERERESTWKIGAFRRGGAVRHRRRGVFCRRTSVGGGEREKGILGRTTWEGREREEFEIFLERSGCFHAGFEG